MIGSAKRHLRRAIPAYIILAVLFLVAAVFSKDFRSPSNLASVVAQSTPLAVAAIGQTFALLMGGIDLSVGSVVSFSTLVMAKLSAGGIPQTLGAALLALAFGALVGLVNGVGITRFHIPPMIMTLSTQALVKGCALYWMPAPGGKLNLQATMFMQQSWGVLSVFGMLLLILYAGTLVYLHRSRAGLRLYAVGANERHALESGLRPGQLKTRGYLFSGLFAALAGVLLAFRMFSGDPVVGDAYSMESVAAVVVGGTALSGGLGGTLGSLAGAFVLSMTNNMLNMLGIFAYYQYIVKGVILVLALALFEARGGRT